MPISVSCQCGKSFQAKDELAGKIVRCPGCGNALQIPAPTPQGGLSDLLSEEGMAGPVGPTCPSCREPIKENAVLCVSCGLNLETGRQLRTATASGLGPGATEADKMLAKAAGELEDEPVHQDEGYGSASGAWLAFAIMLVAVATAAGLMYASFKWIDAGGNARASGVMLGLGIKLFVVGYVWTVVIAFKSGLGDGVFCLLLPPLWMFVSFDQAQVPTILFAVGVVMGGISQLMLILVADEASAGAAAEFIASAVHLGPSAIRQALRV